MQTIYSIAEQVNTLLDGNPTASSRVTLAHIKRLVCQVANDEFKMETLSVSMPSGDTIPSGLMIATYDNVPVTAYKTTLSKCTLPVSPISLPRNMGVFHVSKTDDINSPFIPVPSSLYGVIKPIDILGKAAGLTFYEVYGLDVVFGENLPAKNVNSVFIRLIVSDIDKLGDYDPLPIPADMHAKIIQKVYSLFVGVPEADRSADTNS